MDLAAAHTTAHAGGTVVRAGYGTFWSVRRGVASTSGIRAGGVRAGDLARRAAGDAAVSASRVVARGDGAARERWRDAADRCRDRATGPIPRGGPGRPSTPIAG